MKTRLSFILLFVFYSALICAQPAPPPSNNNAPIPALPLLAVGGMLVLYKKKLHPKA